METVVIPIPTSTSVLERTSIPIAVPTTQASRPLPTVAPQTTPSTRPRNSSAEELQQPQGSPTMMIGLLVALGIFAVLVGIGCLWYLKRRKSQPKRPISMQENLLDNEQPSTSAYSTFFSQNADNSFVEPPMRTVSPTVSIKSLPRIPNEMLQDINNTIADLTIPMVPTKQFPHSGLGPGSDISIATDQVMDIHPLSRRLNSSDIQFIQDTLPRQVSVVGTTSALTPE
jgi:hypothetical protein